MAQPGESKLGAGLNYELDSHGVEIFPYNPAFATTYDRGSAKQIFLDGKSWRAHRLPPNFLANMNMYIKFLSDRPPDNLYEQMNRIQFEGNNVRNSLEQMSEEAPMLFGYFVDKYEQWSRVTATQAAGALASLEDIEFKRQVEQLANDHEYQARRLLYGSSAYAYLAPRVQGDSPRWLYT